MKINRPKNDMPQVSDLDNLTAFEYMGNLCLSLRTVKGYLTLTGPNAGVIASGVVGCPDRVYSFVELTVGNVPQEPPKEDGTWYVKRKLTGWTVQKSNEPGAKGYLEESFHPLRAAKNAILKAEGYAVIATNDPNPVFVLWRNDERLGIGDKWYPLSENCRPRVFTDSDDAREKALSFITIKEIV